MHPTVVPILVLMFHRSISHENADENIDPQTTGSDPSPKIAPRRLHSAESGNKLPKRGAWAETTAAQVLTVIGWATNLAINIII